MQLDIKNPATPDRVDGANLKTFQYKNTTSKTSNKQECRFDITRMQFNALKLMSELLDQKPAPAPEYNKLPSLDECRAQWTPDFFKGALLAAKPIGGLRKGDVCGTLANGYVQVYHNYKPYRAHRILFMMYHKREPIGQIDHIDGNRSNNRIENLREVTPRQNAQNRFTCSSNSGHLGVSRYSDDGLYEAYIGANNKTVHLGKYTRLKCAIAARKHAESILFDLPAPIVGRAA